MEPATARFATPKAHRTPDLTRSAIAVRHCHAWPWGAVRRTDTYEGLGSLLLVETQPAETLLIPLRNRFTFVFTVS